MKSIKIVNIGNFSIKPVSVYLNEERKYQILNEDTIMGWIDFPEPGIMNVVDIAGFVVANFKIDKDSIDFKIDQLKGEQFCIEEQCYGQAAICVLEAHYRVKIMQFEIQQVEEGQEKPSDVVDDFETAKKVPLEQNAFPEARWNPNEEFDNWED